MSQLVRTVDPEVVKRWNEMLASKTASPKAKADEVMESFSVKLFDDPEDTYSLEFRLSNGDADSGPFLDVSLWDDGTEVFSHAACSDRLDRTFFFRDSYMNKEYTVEIRPKLLTSGGVEIPVDNHGNPLRDAPGKYDRSARAMGSAVTHLPPDYAHPAKFSMNMKRISMPGQVLLVVYKLPRSGKPNDEYASLQMNEDLARDIIESHELWATCQRCNAALKDGLCKDETCPFSDHEQSCPVGWMGHDAHPNVNEDTECDCGRNKGKTA